MSDSNIWDDYGKWDEFAKLENIADVKAAIAGDWVWRPNFVPAAIAYIMEYAVSEMIASGSAAVPTAVDFGCGLGRNGPMLGRFFPRVIGVDLPEMIARLEADFPSVVAKSYGGVYSSVASLAAAEEFCLIYDSVVFQHIADRAYVANVIDTLCERPGFRTLISVYFSGGMAPPHLDVLQEKGWRIWHSEVEVLSFEGVPHNVTAFRR